MIPGHQTAVEPREQLHFGQLILSEKRHVSSFPRVSSRAVYQRVNVLSQASPRKRGSRVKKRPSINPL